MYLLGKYATQTTFRFPMNVQGATDFAQAANWTPVAGDVLISKDGGNVAQTTNLPVIVGGAGAAFWQLTLTAAEMTGKEIDVQIVDLSGPKAVADQGLIIYTHGNAAAQIAQDLTVGVQPANLLQVLGLSLVAGGAGGQLIGT